MSANPPSEGAVFGVARKIQSDEARLEYLNQVCGDDTARRDRILQLLDGDKRDSFLEKPIVTPEATRAASDLAEKGGQAVGPYKLLQQIGEGGFGIVHMAEQQRPVRRKVALKVIKPGMDTKEVIGRFEAERQALAMMDHPNIARVLDAGTTEAGRPYFVMELVKGIPITDYCDRQRLGTRERLKLFVNVCQAVQHAHQKGVIHRDIKPSNVLVTEHDATPVPKVIDFGVAKAINQQLTERTLFTRFQQMVGTPMYMSPEQADLSGLDVDTRTDVYSLGVLLYELLTGTTPFDKQRFSKVAYDEIRRVIREEEPPKPSTRVSSLGDTASAISQYRRTDPKRLSQLMRGELDWVIMKAIDKDRTRRYETANSFALDVQRFLDDEPVSAAAPSAFYRFRKFARRNTVAMAVTATIAASLVIGVGAATVSYIRERDARQIAEQRGQEADDARGEAEEARAAEKEERMKAQANERRAFDSEQEARGHQYAAELNFAFSAQERFDTTQVIKLLERQVPVDGDFDPRGWEWRHLWWKTHQNLATIQTHGEGVWGIRSLAISPDRRSLLVAGDVGHPDKDNWRSLIKLVDLESLRITKTLPAIDAASITKLDYFSNARFLAVDCLGYDGNNTFRGVTLLDVEADTISRPISQLAGTGWPTIITPDGSWAVGTFTGIEVRLVTVVEPEEIPSEGTASMVIAKVRDTWHFRVFDIEGNQVADRSAAELAAGEHLERLSQLLRENWIEPHPTAIRQEQIYWSASKALGIPYLWHVHRLRCFDVETGEELAKSLAFEDQSWDQSERIQLSPDGQLLAVGGYPGVRLLSLPELKILRSVDIGDYVSSLAWSPDARLLAVALGSEGGQIRDATTGELKVSLKGNTAAPVYRVQFSDDGSLVACAAGQSVVVWEVDTGDIRDVFSQDGGASALAFLPDGKRLATSDKAGNVRLWNLSPSKETDLKELTRVVDAKYSPDGRLLAAISGGVVRLFDAQSEELVASLESPGHLPAGQVARRDTFVFGTPICFSPDGQLLAAANGDRTATIYDLVARKPVHVLRGHTDTITDVTFSSDSKQLVTAGRYEEERLRFWSTTTGALTATEKAAADRELHAVQFSPNGKLLAYGDHSVHLWSVEKRKLLKSGPRIDEATSIRFSPDGSLLAWGNKSGEVRFHSVPSLELVLTFTGLNGHVRDLSFSPDGVNLLAVSRGGIARVFNLKVMSEVGDVDRSSSDPVIAGEFSPDGKSLAVVSRQGSVRQFHAIAPGQIPHRESLLGSE